MGWEKFWLRRIRKRASPAENSEKKPAKSIACENYHLAGPRPLYFTQKTHAERKNQPFPPLKGDPVTPVHGLFTRDDSELWVGGRAECEPRATPLSTRSILRRIPTSRSPFFSFSVVPPGRPTPPSNGLFIHIILFPPFLRFPLTQHRKHTFQKPWW